VTSVSEPRTIRLRDREVPYLVKRSQKRRSIVLTVDQNGLAVHAPWRSSMRRIEAAVLEGERWILRKLEEWSRYPARRQTWADGDGICYLGRDLKLEVVTDMIAQTATLMDDDILRIALPEPGNRAMVQAAVVKWYRRHAQSHFSERIACFAPQLGVPVPRLFLSSARTRSGSCNAKGDVRLNWRLVQASQATVDYVVVHELAHLVEMNHSRRFWTLVARICPAYKEACVDLDRMGLYYMDI
jgi:predicted metal-dependent hydrolase